MESSSEALINCFAAIGYLGAAIVIVGIIAESNEVLKESLEVKSFRMGVKRHLSKRWLFVMLWFSGLAKSTPLRWKAIAVLFVVVGLAIEWVGGGTAELMQTKENEELVATNTELLVEVATLNKDAQDSRLKADTLEQLINETKTNVANADTRNFQILSIEAHAIIIMRPYQPFDMSQFGGINVGTEFGIMKNDSGKNLQARLDLGRSTMLAATNWYFDKWGRNLIFADNVSPWMYIEPTTGEKVVRLDLCFGEQNSEFPFINGDGISSSDVDAIALILPYAGEVLRGNVEMKINGSIQRTFQIPMQRTWRWSSITSIEKNDSFVPFDFGMPAVK